jgi:hypothetical protein
VCMEAQHFYEARQEEQPGLVDARHESCIDIFYSSRRNGR